MFNCLCTYIPQHYIYKYMCVYMCVCVYVCLFVFVCVGCKKLYSTGPWDYIHNTSFSSYQIETNTLECYIKISGKACQ